MSKGLALAGLLLATPAVAQPAPAHTAAIDPARLAAAERLIHVLMPPDRFDAMIDTMSATMTRSLAQQFKSSQLVEAFGQDPRLQPILERYVQRMSADSMASMRAGLPQMTAAMQRAYARRFTVAQMAEVERFFASPTGKLYMDEGMTVMADPDVVAWQQQMMKAQFDRLPVAIQAMRAEILALPPQEKQP